MKRTLVMIGLSLSILSTAEAAPSIIINGSFEEGSYPGTYTPVNPGDTDIVGWTVGAVNVDYVDTYWIASDGSRSLDLNGYAGYGVVAAGSVEQTFTTVAGQWYCVTFDMASNPDGILSPVKSLMVEADGQSAVFSSSANPKLGQWDSITWTFLADGDTTLKFSSLMIASGDNGWGPALDNVCVTAAPIPAPGAIVLCSFGTAIAGALRRKALRV